MSGDPATRGGSPAGKWFERLHALTSGCSRLPLVAGLALVVSARVVPLVAEPAPVAGRPEALLAEPMSADAAIIDAVLAKRAPDLGLTLRRQLGQAISEEAARTRYDPLLILAIIDVESDFEEEAISEKGARGLMQIKPSTLHFLAQKEGLRLTREEVAKDPALCVRLGIRYLRGLQERFRRYPKAVRRDFRRLREGEGLGGDWTLALRPTLDEGG